MYVYYVYIRVCMYIYIYICVCVCLFRFPFSLKPILWLTHIEKKNTKELTAANEALCLHLRGWGEASQESVAYTS